MSELPAIQSVEKYGLTIFLRDFGQDALSSYQMETIKAARDAFFQFAEDGTGVTAQAYVRGITVRSALRNKIISGIEIEKVGDMKPYAVEWIADEIKKHVAEVVKAPNDPNSSGQ